MKQDQTPFAAQPTPDEAASCLPEPNPFDPVLVRPRRDGWTPQKQREFIEALADTGVVREAAARVGMTQQSAWRLRRRPDARAFDVAWDAALHHGARRLHAVAWERAIEGVTKGHYYHGELKGEERVYDNRLLIYLLGRAEMQRARWQDRDAALADWDGWMEMIGEGLPPPAVPEEEQEEAEEDELGALGPLDFFVPGKQNH